MQVHHGLASIPSIQRPVVTSGTFDGVHLGHVTILDRLKEIAKACDGETVVLSFWPHPRFVLQGDACELKLLSTLQEKIQLLKAYGIDHLVILPFTKEFSKKTSQEFIQEVIVDGLHTHKLVIGYDHRFGRNREGGFDYLKANQDLFPFAIEEIPRHDVDNVGISSTKIRKALEEGQVEQATKYLGRPYSLSGTVVKGKQLGRTIGFPTANIQPEISEKLVPAIGVYAIQALIGKKPYGGMLNIGMRPTVDNEKHISIEAHLFDCREKLYDEEITVAFIGRIRNEQKFPSLEALIEQLHNDKVEALKILVRSTE